MAKEKRYRAPKYYGAWVGGDYYNPGEYLPEGTTEYRVTAIEDIEDGGDNWKTVHAMFEVGTSFDDIDDEIYSLFEDLAEIYLPGEE